MIIIFSFFSLHWVWNSWGFQEIITAWTMRGILLHDSPANGQVSCFLSVPFTAKLFREECIFFLLGVLWFLHRYCHCAGCQDTQYSTHVQYTAILKMYKEPIEDTEGKKRKVSSDFPCILLIPGVEFTHNTLMVFSLDIRIRDNKPSKIPSLMALWVYNLCHHNCPCSRGHLRWYSAQGLWPPWIIKNNLLLFRHYISLFLDYFTYRAVIWAKYGCIMVLLGVGHQKVLYRSKSIVRLLIIKCSLHWSDILFRMYSHVQVLDTVF